MSKLKNKKIIIIFLSLLLIIFLIFIGLKINTNHNPKIKKNNETLRVKYLVMKKTNNNYSLKESLIKHFDDFLSFADSYIDVKKEGNYYVANLKHNANNEIIKNITDYAFANNNNNAEMINDASYNKKTKEIKIPKKYFEKKENNKKIINPVQMEFLIRMSEKEAKQLPVKVMQKNFLSSKKTLRKNIQDDMITTNITIKKNLNKKNLKVLINNDTNEISNKSFTYNSKNGKLTLNISPILLNDIKIVKTGKIQRILNINKVNAKVKYLDNGYGVNTIKVENQLTKGSGDVKLNIIHLKKARDDNNNYYVYRIYGWTRSKTISKDNFANVDAGDFSKTQIDDLIGFNTDDASSKFGLVENDFYISATCAHISMPGDNRVGLDGIENDAKFNYRIVPDSDANTGTIYVMLDPSYSWTGTLTSGVEQTLITFFKYKVDSPPQHYKAVWYKTASNCSNVGLGGWDFNIYRRKKDDDTFTTLAGTAKSDNSGEITFTTNTDDGGLRVLADEQTDANGCALNNGKTVMSENNCVTKFRGSRDGIDDLQPCVLKNQKTVYCDAPSKENNTVNICYNTRYGACFSKEWSGPHADDGDGNETFKIEQDGNLLGYVSEGDTFILDGSDEALWMWGYTGSTCVFGLTSSSNIIVSEVNPIVNTYAWDGTLRIFKPREGTATSLSLAVNTYTSDDTGYYHITKSATNSINSFYEDEVGFCLPLIKVDKLSKKRICASNSDKDCFFKEAQKPKEIIENLADAEHSNVSHEIKKIINKEGDYDKSLNNISDNLTYDLENAILKEDRNDYKDNEKFYQSLFAFYLREDSFNSKASSKNTTTPLKNTTNINYFSVLSNSDYWPKSIFDSYDKTTPNNPKYFNNIFSDSVSDYSSVFRNLYYNENLKMITSDTNSFTDYNPLGSVNYTYRNEYTTYENLHDLVTKYDSKVDDENTPFVNYDCKLLIDPDDESSNPWREDSKIFTPRELASSFANNIDDILVGNFNKYCKNQIQDYQKKIEIFKPMISHLSGYIYNIISRKISSAWEDFTMNVDPEIYNNNFTKAQNKCTGNVEIPFDKILEDGFKYSNLKTFLNYTSFSKKFDSLNNLINVEDIFYSQNSPLGEIIRQDTTINSQLGEHECDINSYYNKVKNEFASSYNSGRSKYGKIYDSETPVLVRFNSDANEKLLKKSFLAITLDNYIYIKSSNENNYKFYTDNNKCPYKIKDINKDEQVNKDEQNEINREKNRQDAVDKFWEYVKGKADFLDSSHFITSVSKNIAYSLEKSITNFNQYNDNYENDKRKTKDLTNNDDKESIQATFNISSLGDKTTDPRSGMLFLNNLPGVGDYQADPPTYTITETKAPQGWSTDITKSKEISAFNNHAYNYCLPYAPFYNLRLKLNWGKSSYYNNGHDINLKKAQFKVAKVDDNGEVIPNKYIGVEKDLVEVEDDNNGVITKKKCYVANNLDKNENEASILESGNAETKNDGEVCLIGLDEGSYKIIETKPPEYHTFCDIKELTLKASEHFKKLVGQSTNDKERTLFYNCSTNYEFSKSITNEDIITNNQSDSDNTNNTSKQLDYELTKLDFNLVATSAPDTKLSFYDLGDGVYEYKSGYKDLTREKASDEEEHDVVDILHLNKNRKFRVNFLPYNVEYEVKEAEKENCNDVNGNNCSTLGFYLNDEDSNKSVFNIDEYSNNSKEEFSDKFQSSTLETLLAKSSMQNTATEIHFKKEDIYKYYDENTLSDDEKHKNEVLFDTFTFKLYDINNNEVKLEEISPGLYKFNKDDNYVDSDGNTITIKKVNELHTHNGKLTITNLCAGNTYRLEEVSQPAQAAFILPDDHPSITYTISKTKTEMIANKDDEEKIITNKPTRVVVQKKDNKTNEDMKEGKSVKEKARFKVYRCDKTYISKCTYELSNKKPINFTPLGKIEGDLEDPGEDVYRVVPNSHIKNGEKYVNDLNLNENGRLILRYLPSGYKYVIVEENAPDGYFNLDSPLNEVSIEPNPNNTDASGIFTNYATEIKFKKDDIYKYYKKEDLDALKSQTQIFDSMTFVLRDQDGNIVNLYKVQDGVYRFINNDGETNGEETSLHTLNGEMLIRNLYRDETYYIEEIRSDTKGDFILPNNIDNSSLIENRAKAKLGNNHHPIVKYNIPDKISEAAIDGEVPESLTRLIDNLPSRVVFEKRDVKTGELIYDEENQDDMHKEIYTTFNVYRCNPDVVTCTKKNGELIYFEDRERNADLTKDVDPTAIEKDASLGTIRVYKYSKLNSKNNAIKDLHTDRGMLVLSYLPSGYYEPDNEGKSNKDVFKQYKYVLVETVAPNGYYNPTDLENETEFTVIHSSTIDDKNYETLTEKVLNTPTEIHFVKSDFYDYYNAKDLASVKSDEQIFDSMRFVLRDRNGKILKLKCADAYNYKDVKGKECKTGQYRYLPYKSNENTIEELRTQDGKFMISHLYRNETYYIEEVKTDDEGDFILSKDFNYPGLPFENHGHPVVKYVLPENEPPTMESVTREIRNLPTRVVFQKRDLKYGNIISEEVGKEKTTFNIRLCNEDVSLSDCNVNNSKIVYFKDRALLNDKYNLNDIDNGKEVYKYSKLNDSKDAVYNLHPYKGELILRYLPAGYYKDKERKNYVKYNYILVETVAPPKYDLPTNGNEITRFNVVNDTINVDVIEKPNKPTKILIEKTDGETGERIRGTKFKLYKIPNNNGKSVYDPNKALLNQQMNLVKLHTVRDGEYEENTDLAVLDTNIFTTCSNNCSDISKDLWSTFSNSRYSDDQLSKEEDEVIVKQGQAIIQYLDINTYYVIEEVEAPEGYRLPEKREDRLKLVYIPESDENVYVKTSQANLENYFQFYKFDEYNNLLDGAKFKLQKLDDNKKYHDVDIVFDEERSKQKNMQIYRMLDTKYSETLDKDYITLIDENEDKDKDKTTEDKKNIITTKDGTAVIYRLAEGQYRILEVEAAPGKELPKKTINVATFFVDSDGKVYGSSIITNKKPTIPNVVRPSANAELQVDVQTGKLRVRYSIIIAIVITIIGILFYRLYRKKVKK